MYQIHGFSMSSNTAKTIYVAEALGVDYQYITLDLMKGEHKTPEHFKRHPLGKTPTLTHDDKTLFESGAICRYLASEENSDLYPLNDNFKRCQIDQWMDFFTIHLGRWVTTYAFELVAKEKFGMGEPNQEVMKEALGFIEQQMQAVDQHLANNRYFLGDQLTIADLFAFAYMENAEMANLSLTQYPHVSKWYEDLKASDIVQRGKQKMHAA